MTQHHAVNVLKRNLTDTRVARGEKFQQYGHKVVKHFSNCEASRRSISAMGWQGVKHFSNWVASSKNISVMGWQGGETFQQRLARRRTISAIVWQGCETFQKLGSKEVKHFSNGVAR
ncbi:hypothetical protein DPMN_097405 [Dreissena polymorpha]|uniref:Uncharacterized protein n=1 Tax=Dreissena polymorpha TaxID=45954 RepID=A0A9D4LCV9_DREPO|nr:hypothetical protein DPMN_097405 [Dreissena polymorpha]